MTVFATYSDLQNSIARWLNREDDPDILARAAEFIELAEAKIRRKQEWFYRIYSLENSGTPLAITDVPQDLGSDVLRVTEMWASTDSWKNPITILTPTAWRDLAHSNNNTQGIPTHAVIVPEMDTWMKNDGTRTGPKLFLWPTPATDGSYSVDFQYVRDVPPLATDATTNGLFLRHPDLYLYGALVESAPFYEHDSRLPLWKDRFDSAVDEINLERERAELGSSNKRVRLPRSF
jgi:hypothetical protein